MKTSGPYRVLVVDDDETILNLFSTFLRREGYEVSTAATGGDGLRQHAESPADIVLLDINLPDISGIEVMRQIVRTSSVIVILVTGDGGTYSPGDAEMDGAADFVIKPVRLIELVRRIRQAIDMRRLTEARDRLVADLERLAIRDELTDLFNYRHFQTQLKSESQRALRYQRPLSLIVFDVDNFKSVNDTYGHTEGDRVLAGIARALGACMRGSDNLFRYGGEEFAALLPETHAEQAYAVAERSRLAVESSGLLKARVVSVSAGVAELSPSETAQDLIRRADQALYAAKRAGRNRVQAA